MEEIIVLMETKVKLLQAFKSIDRRKSNQNKSHREN